MNGLASGRGTYLHDQVVGMLEMEERVLAVKLTTALAKDFTLEEPPDHDPAMIRQTWRQGILLIWTHCWYSQLVDQTSLLLVIPVTVVHWLPVPELSPQRSW
jgi:hypothetical protein